MTEVAARVSCLRANIRAMTFSVLDAGDVSWAASVSTRPHVARSSSGVDIATASSICWTS